MKKLFLLLALVSLGFAGCSTDFNEKVPSNQMRFSSAVGKNNNYKATEVTNHDFERFTIHAYNTGSTSSEGIPISDNVDMSRKYIDAGDIVRSGGEWGNQEKYYWSMKEQDMFQFFAYSGTSITYREPTSSKGFPSLEYTIKSVENQEDLLIAQSLNNQQSENGGEVSLRFKHALTQVNLSVKLAENNSKLKYTIIEIKIRNVKNTGIFNYKENNDYGSWSNQSGNAEYSYFEGNEEILGDITTEKSFGNGEAFSDDNNNVGGKALMLMPQTLEDVVIAITYKVEKQKADNSWEEIYNGTKELQINGGDGGKAKDWVQGKKVRYKLNLPKGAEKMSFTTEVTEWEIDEIGVGVIPAPSTLTLTENEEVNSKNLSRLIDEINGVKNANKDNGIIVKNFPVEIKGTSISTDIELNLASAGVDYLEANDQIKFDFSSVLTSSSNSITIILPLVVSSSAWTVTDEQGAQLEINEGKLTLSSSSTKMYWKKN